MNLCGVLHRSLLPMVKIADRVSGLACNIAVSNPDAVRDNGKYCTANGDVMGCSSVVIITKESDTEFGIWHIARNVPLQVTTHFLTLGGSGLLGSDHDYFAAL